MTFGPLILAEGMLKYNRIQLLRPKTKIAKYIYRKDVGTMDLKPKGSYEIKIEPLEKKFSVFVSGNADPAAVQGFVNEFKQKTGEINTGEYELVVDCREMKVEAQEMTDKLASVFQMYDQAGFKKIIFEISNVIVKMQIHRVLRSTGIKNAEIVDV